MIGPFLDIFPIALKGFCPYPSFRVSLIARVVGDFEKYSAETPMESPAGNEETELRKLIKKARCQGDSKSIFGLLISQA
ncbi:MAG TPA: hypothetical protein VE641_05280 [Chthoniobacterales bacterium]|jgi:hypothetical protein|nr:hypothetical protein [Chthoniobacterales bacterium]